MQIVYSSKFAKDYKKLPDNIKDLAEKQEKIFRQNPFDYRLKTHKLKGRLKELLSFSIGRKYRIIFEFDKDKEIIYFCAVGDHNIYQ